MLQKITHIVLKIFALCILGFLAVNSFFHTQRYGREELGEILNGAPIYKEADFVLLHVAAIVGFVVLVWLLLGKTLPEGKKRSIPVWLPLLVQGVLALAGGIFAFCLLQDGMRPPADDQVQVYSAAMLFNEGNFTNLTPGGYVEMYPQQLGYILYLQGLFRLFGTTSYVLVQQVNCVFIVGLLWMMSLVLNCYVEHAGMQMLGGVLLALNMPIYFLHTWVYGDVPFLFFAFVFWWLWLKAEATLQENEHIKWTHIIGLVLSACAMLLFRKNALVVLIGAFILLLLQGIVGRKKICILLAAGVIMAPILLSNTVTASYEKTGGQGTLRGLPSTCWIAMGMIEGQSKPGWFNNYGVPTYYENDCNYEATNEQAKDMIGRQVREFVEDPAMAISFYKRKICTQWNDPYYNTRDMITGKGAVKGGISGWLESHDSGLMRALDEVQLLTYLGAFFYVLLDKKKDLLSYLTEILLVGGFLFSILWEGNSRYIYPYVLLMMPPAVWGWKEALNGFNRIWYRMYCTVVKNEN